MNLVSVNNGNLVTTSLAIAEGVGVQHKNILETIRKNSFDFQEFGAFAFETRKSGGRQTEIAILNEPQATLLLTYMRNNEVVKKFKKSLVKAFFEMRDQLSAAPQQVELSRMDILKLAMEAEKENQVLQQKIMEDAPHVEFAKRVENSHGAISIAEAAKLIGTGRNFLCRFLRQEGWITRKNEPYQVRINQGYLDVKLGSFEHPEKGLKETITTLVTGKGLEKIQKLWDRRSHL